MLFHESTSSAPQQSLLCSADSNSAACDKRPPNICSACALIFALYTLHIHRGAPSPLLAPGADSLHTIYLHPFHIMRKIFCHRTWAWCTTSEVAAVAQCTIIFNSQANFLKPSFQANEISKNSCTSFH